MTIIRRVYLYLVAFVSLLTLAGGLAGLGHTLLRAAVADPSRVVPAGEGLRGDVALYGALTLVGLLFWLPHWIAAGRLAAREPAERAAALRRLYGYAVLAVMVLAGGIAAQRLIDTVLQWLIQATPRPTAEQLVDPLPALVVAAAFWLYHRRVILEDRRLVGERAAAATLRRWYVYATALVALLLLLSSAVYLLRAAWESAVAAIEGTAVRTGAAGIAGRAATALVALALWLLHWQRWAVAAPPRGGG